ncbi:DUF4038 domain-containing protein [Tunturibacter empetritectus]|uniref:apiosidase-like domain-containing protein n=1 Tax=Tunturiibacter empetritectus TaxID=3069691 RepID=UPI0015CC0AB5
MLETERGEPFFWLADTAWQLMHALAYTDCEYYFVERARQGFTVIQNRRSVLDPWNPYAKCSWAHAIFRSRFTPTESGVL